MLARAAARRPEAAVRAALGASRLRLIRQMLSESILLALGGALLGWALAVWACQATVRFWAYSPQYPITLNLRPDARVLAFAIGITLATALLVGLLPALRASAANLAASARRETPAAALGWRLIAGQMALALVLLAGAGLFARSLARLAGPAKGFNAKQVLLVRFPSVPHDITPAQARALEAERRVLLPRLRALPGIAAAASSMIIPSQGSTTRSKLGLATPGAPQRLVLDNFIAGDYFAALQTPLLRGRAFAPSDAGAAVVILNAALARRLFLHGGALGSDIASRVGFITPHPAYRVVGIVANAKYYSLTIPAPPAAYFPIPRRGCAECTIYLRSQLPQALLAREIRPLLTGANAGAELATLQSVMDSGIKPQRQLALLSELFGVLALVLAGLGLYGVTAYNAARRRREFGIRVALGATSGAIAAQVLRGAAVALASGLAAGFFLAWLLTSVLRAEMGKLLFGITARDASTWVLAAIALAVVAALASWWPARRAAHADAMASLREE